MEQVTPMPSEMLMPYLAREFSARNPGEVTWSHAVNNVAKLSKSINNPTTMFIESDIRMSPRGVVVCVHPPEVKSDLTMEHLVESMKSSKQGLKLDFKDPETVAPTLEALKAAGLKQPVLLNADILQGNGANPSKFDPNEFIRICQQIYPQGILSLGWTTTAMVENPYTQENVDEMIRLAFDVDEVTYPVRACLLPGSWEALSKLIQKEGRTLSIWNNEPVDTQTIVWIKASTSPSKTFYDFIDDNKDPLKLL